MDPRQKKILLIGGGGIAAAVIAFFLFRKRDEAKAEVVTSDVKSLEETKVPEAEHSEVKPSETAHDEVLRLEERHHRHREHKHKHKHKHKRRHHRDEYERGDYRPHGEGRGE